MIKLERVLSTLFFLTLLFLLVWVSLSQIKEETKAHIYDSLKTVTKTTHEALYIWIEHRKNDLKEIAQEPLIISQAQNLLTLHKQKAKLKSSEPLIRLREFMSKKMSIHNDIGFFIISPDFYNLASMRDENIGVKNLIYQERFEFIQQAFLGQTLFIPPVLSDVALLTSSGELVEKLPTIFMATPIKDPLGKVIAVLAIRLELTSDFTHIAQLGRIGDTGETYAFDANATMISNSRFDHQLQNVGLVKGRNGGMLSIRIVDPGGNLLEGYKAKMDNKELPLTYMAKQALSGKNEVSLVSYRDYRGVLVFGTWVWDKSLGFGLATEIDVKEALASYYNTRISILSFMFLVVFLSIIAQVVLIRSERHSKKKLKKLNDDLELKVAERTAELELLTIKDGLTNVGNRRLFEKSIDSEWQRGIRYQKALSVLMIDIDNFKNYNDFYGHQKGDACLRRVAGVLKKSCKRSEDILARYGGEEFVILLPDTELPDAIAFAEICRRKIEEEKIPHKASNFKSHPFVTVSIGVASITPTVSEDQSVLIEKADIQLYKAKDIGKNNVFGLT